MQVEGSRVLEVAMVRCVVLDFGDVCEDNDPGSTRGSFVCGRAVASGGVLNLAWPLSMK